MDDTLRDRLADALGEHTVVFNIVSDIITDWEEEQDSFVPSGSMGYRPAL